MILVAAIGAALVDILAVPFFSWPPIVVSCILGAINHININREASVSLRSVVAAVTFIVFVCATPAWLLAIGPVKPSAGAVAEEQWFGLAPFLALKAIGFMCVIAVSVGCRLVGKRVRSSGNEA
ncbi:MAG TPA: hypothetical protein PLN33_14365 [Hyphomonadaceae bacterium]|jgi:hypothetical protein|nr:hypothetical protein [Hyphomonadaceae bacterium]HPN05822.1 hypothetical protein [Hyphomonadaceae bacterium]